MPDDNLFDRADAARPPLEGAQESRWIVEGIIAAASVNLFAGAPGSFKWWLAWDMARHVANGRAWCNQGTSETRVLYLDLDNPETVSRPRVRMWPSKPRPVAYFGNWGDDLARGIPQLERLARFAELKTPLPRDPVYWTLASPQLYEIAEAFRPLIVFDSLIRFHSENENDNRGMESVMSVFRRFARTGATCLVIHHEYSGQPRGAGEIKAAADDVFIIHRSNRHATLNAAKTRHKVEQSYTVEWSEGGFRPAQAPPPAPAPRRRKKKGAAQDQGSLF